MRSALPRVAAVLAAAAVVAVVILGRSEAETSQAAGDGAGTTRVAFHENAGIKHKRILNLGGLVIRASCIDYGQGRKYLSVGAKTLVDNASRALVLSQRRAGEAQTYSFKSSDFDRSFGWYDLTGTNPDDTTGTLSFARPDGGQVALTFRADQGTPKADCSFEGTAIFLP